MKRRTLGVAAAAIVVACSSGQSTSSSGSWKLVWSDEFDGAALDTTKWSFDVGSDFGTGQQDFDTARPENVSVAGGVLALTARREAYQGASYTSGRIESRAFAQTYGRFEARMQLPKGQGMWPAFWLLGKNFAEVGWPGCGEIDVVECRGADPTTIAGSLHGPGNANYTKGFTLHGGASFNDDFHVFAVEWEPGTIRWYVDDALYQTISADALPRSQAWVFDHPFFVILDLAVGGQYGGPIDDATPLPQSLKIDYVRVYAKP